MGTIFIVCANACLCSCVGGSSCAADQETENYVDALRQSGQYCRGPEKFHIHAVADSRKAAEVRRYFQLDTKQFWAAPNPALLSGTSSGADV